MVKVFFQVPIVFVWIRCLSSKNGVFIFRTTYSRVVGPNDSNAEAETYRSRRGPSLEMCTWQQNERTVRLSIQSEGIPLLEKWFTGWFVCRLCWLSLGWWFLSQVNLYEEIQDHLFCWYLNIRKLNIFPCDMCACVFVCSNSCLCFVVCLSVETHGFKFQRCLPLHLVDSDRTGVDEAPKNFVNFQ